MGDVARQHVVNEMGYTDYGTSLSQGMASRLASAIIQKAVEDLSEGRKNSLHIDGKLSEDAYIYFNSPEFILHCEMANLNPEYILNRNIAYRKEFVEVSLKMKKTRHLAGSLSQDFKRTSKRLLKDFALAKSIVAH